MKNIKTIISFGIGGLILLAHPVMADNCGSYTDCFFTAQAATNVSIALSLGLIAISLLLDFTPVVGTVKGIIESFAGKDVITGTELSTFDRMVGILPFVGGVREITKVEKGIKAVEDISKIEKGVVKIEKAEQEANKIVNAVEKSENIEKDISKAGSFGSYSYDTKIEGQIEKRGWTKELIDDTIKNPNETREVRDTRHNSDGTLNDDPATAYIREDGSYVIKNDKTGEIVQIMHRNKPNWKLPWERK